jgi:hypothetical protein
MLAPEFGPLCELVLAARRVELPTYRQIFFLLQPLLGKLSRNGNREGRHKLPDLSPASAHLDVAIRGGDVGRRLTSPLIVPAPIVLTSWIASSTMKITTSNEAIVLVIEVYRLSREEKAKCFRTRGLFKKPQNYDGAASSRHLAAVGWGHLTKG